MSTNYLAERSWYSTPLWATGEIGLRIEGPSQGYVEISSPYALIGRSAVCDIIIDHESIALQHLYLHLSPYGLFGVDLSSGYRSYIGPKRQLSAWLTQGDSLQIGDWSIKVDRLTVGSPVVQKYVDSDPITNDVNQDLCDITLYPDDGPPLVLRSELVFVGSSYACGVYIHDQVAAPIHCVLVRTQDAVYCVNLARRDIAINSQEIYSPVILRDGDIIRIAHSYIKCRISNHNRSYLSHVQTIPIEQIDSLHGQALSDGLITINSSQSLCSDPHSELIAWLLRILQVTQGELLRRQSAFQQELAQALCAIGNSQSNDLVQCMQKIENLQRDLSAYRDEAHCRSGAVELGKTTVVPRPNHPLAPSGKVEPADDGMTAAWLMRRIQQINQELGPRERGRGKGA